MEPLQLVVSLWLGFAVGIMLGLIVSGALDPESTSD
jgi:hypothetical protein